MSANAYDDFEELWGSTEAKTTSGPLPEGKYDAEITSVKEGQWEDGSKRIEWAFKVTDGEYAGRTAWMNGGLQGEKLGTTKGHFCMLGFEGLPYSHIVAAMPSLTGRAVKISVSDFKGKLYTHLNSASAPVTVAAPAVAPPVQPAPAQQPALPGIPAAANNGSPF